MENASKALIMAGSVLIALMVIAALVLMFRNITAYQETSTRSTRSTQISEFNSEYETYDRTNVRGSDLYSLLNKVIDYNRRQSTEGTEGSDAGSEIGYEPMSITFTISRTELTADGTIRLFTGNSDTYTVSGDTNTFESSIKSTIDDLEDTYGQSSLTNLTTNLTSIFIDSSDTQEQQTAVSKFNSASKKVSVSSYSEIKSGSTIRNDVYKYYEYVQFKRAYFNCTSTEYNESTGRIISMVFEFTGKFN